MEKLLRNKASIAAMMLPAMVLFILFVPIPAISSVGISFTNWRGLGEMKFVGLKNYMIMFTKDPVLQQALINTAKWVFGGLVLMVIPSFSLALLLDKKIGGKGFYRSVIFLPATFSAVAVSLLWYFIYHPEIGLLNQFVRLFGAKDFSYAWLRDEKFALWGVMISGAWQWAGYYMVILLSGLAGIPADVVEAAEIDGATYWQVVKHIYMPYLKPVFKIICILSVTGAFKGFASVYVMTQGGPNNKSMLLGLHMYKRGFEAMNYGYGSAISVLIIMCCVVSTLLINRFFRRDPMEG